MSTEKPWFLYMLRCGDGSLYTGISTDVTRRLAEHKGESGNGCGAKALRGRRPLTLVFSQAIASRSKALSLEHRVKRLAREQKEALATGKIKLESLNVRSGT